VNTVGLLGEQALIESVGRAVVKADGFGTIPRIETLWFERDGLLILESVYKTAFCHAGPDRHPESSENTGFGFRRNDNLFCKPIIADRLSLIVYLNIKASLPLFPSGKGGKGEGRENHGSQTHSKGGKDILNSKRPSLLPEQAFL